MHGIVQLSGIEELKGLKAESFAIVLVQQIPDAVRTKLESWGVLDFSALFRRSIGLHAVFAEFPTVERFATRVSAPLSPPSGFLV